MYDLYMHMGKVPEIRGRGCRRAPSWSDSSDAKVFVLYRPLFPECFYRNQFFFSGERVSINMKYNAPKF